jgi:tetratricopeptide (TPR) repeat protein
MLYSRLWKIEAHRGNYPQATDYLLKTQAVLKKGDDQQAISYNYNNLGNLYERQGDYDLAWKYYEDSLRIKRDINDLWGIAWTLRNMIILSVKQDNLKQAELLMDELSTIDPDSFQTQLVLARFEYEKGHFQRAASILTSHREEAIATGVWTTREETTLNAYALAQEAGKKQKLPEQFGNFY